MRSLKNFLDFYINSNIHVSFSVMAFIGIESIMLGIPVFKYGILGFSGTYVLYHLTRFMNHKNYTNSHRLAHWSQKHQFLLFGLFVIMFFLNLYSVYHLHVLQWFWLILLSLLTLLYGSTKITYYKQVYSLRFIPGIKIWVISFVWMGVVTVLPMMELRVLPDNWFLHCLFSLLYVVALTIPFDIRDVVFDSPKLKTLPQVLGVQKSKILIFILLIICAVLLCFLSSYLILLSFLISNLCFVVLLFFSFTTNKYLTSFFVEGIPILWLCIYHFIS